MSEKEVLSVPVHPRARKNLKELHRLDREAIISPNPPPKEFRLASGSDLGMQFVKSARKLGDALDNAFNDFSDYYKRELEAKVNETWEGVTRRTRDLKTELGKRTGEISGGIMSLFKKIW